ncbi:MAG: deoxyguanosinetriphosphate triphosphohydrolase [Anaerolineae bacterium]|nr:deoxyguanosinetriphosphate triphosphohydrolase [Anaerolineae bacterium]
MILDRHGLEAQERATLAPYAMKSGDSRGRVYPENEHPYRSAFQRDRDRVIHTTAFRRLQYKTQVFVYHEGDHYRSRLTHTIEVAQIGRTLARALRANEDLSEAICLAHDLGHPPFGHTGEETLNELMADAGGFNHQRQTVRILEKLERRYPDHPGLNLTYEVREGVVKHDTDYDLTDATGYEPERAGTLECQLANLADEIAYNTADLEDGLRSEILEPREVQQLALWQEVMDSLGERHDAEITTMLRRRAIRRLIGKEVSDAIRYTDARLSHLGIDSVDKLRDLGSNVASVSPEREGMNRELKRLLLSRFYRHFRVMRMANKASRTLTDLYRAYVEQPLMLPTDVRAKEKEEHQSLRRVICDYIAGMTDRYALAEHARLFDPNERS